MMLLGKLTYLIHIRQMLAIYYHCATCHCFLHVHKEIWGTEVLGLRLSGFFCWLPVHGHALCYSL